MRILLAGGGTGGPVVPLIAIAQRIRDLLPNAQFLFLDSNNSPAIFFCKKHSINFVSIPAGKWRRYFSLKNFLTPFEVIAGFFKSFFLIRKFQPDLVLGAGGYVSVPVIAAAYTQGKKVLIHQQDVRPSLSNKLVAMLADRITVSFKSSIREFDLQSGLGGYNDQKVFWTGNPVRKEVLRNYSSTELKDIKRKFSVAADLPVIVLSGGATGALELNNLIEKALPALTKFSQVIHITGPGKQTGYSGRNYKQYPILENMPELLSIADIVIARAGLSTIAELAVMQKVSIIVPIPDSHQQENALLLNDANAAVILDQSSLTPELLIDTIRKLMFDGQWQAEIKKNIKELMPVDAAEKIAKIILDLCNHNKESLKS